MALAAEGGLAEQGAFQSNGFAGGIFIEAICDLYGLLGGSLGAMFTSAAVVTGLVAAAVGGFQSIRSAAIVAISCFAITSSVSVYFGTFNCGAGGGGAVTREAALAPDNDPFGRE